MRLYLLLMVLSMIVGELFGQHLHTPMQNRRSNLVALDLAVVRGNAPLYVLDGDLISTSIVTTVGVGANYQTDFLGNFFWNTGLRVFSVSSDFDHAPTGGDQENIVSRSRFMAIPFNLGAFKQFQTARFEFSAGIEYSKILAQKEQNISTTRLVIIEERIVNLNQSSVQKNNLQFLATLLIAKPISENSSTYLAVDAHYGLIDLDHSIRKQKINRLAFRMGVRYGW